MSVERIFCIVIGYVMVIFGASMIWGPNGFAGAAILIGIAVCLTGLLKTEN